MSRLARAPVAREPPSWRRSGCESRCGLVSEGQRGRGRGLGGNRHALLTPRCPDPYPQGSPSSSGSASSVLRDTLWTCTTLWT